MADENPTEPKQSQRDPEKRAKKTYTKPTFRFERVFETQALSCGKITSLGQCHLNRKTS